MQEAAVCDPVRRYRSLLRRRLCLLGGLVVLLAAALLADVLLGTSAMPFSTLFDTLLHPGAVDAVNRAIVWNIRLPTALMAVLAGMALGIAGAEMQTVLDNPLASPYTLGVSSAAALGASLAIVFGLAVPGLPADWAVSANAFVFAMLAGVMLDAVARWRGMPSDGIVLLGIALVFLFNALVSMIQFAASAQALQNLVFWTMGSLSRADWSRLAGLAAALALTLPFSMRAAWRLTSLRLGEDRAASFGVDVRGVRLGALARVSVLSALVVSAVGVIGFVGLVAPHIARRVFGEDHRFYLPASGLLGALVLSMASTVSKQLVPDVVVPIGIVTAMVGIPFFLAAVVRRPVQ